MSGAQAGRLIGVALRCYPARWRRRHADEAAEVAVLLIRDGAPAASVAWSYFLGAAREWLMPRPGRPQNAVAAALLALTCMLGISAALIAETAPARAAGTTQPSSTAPKAGPAPTATPAPRHAAPCRIPAAERPRLSVPEAAHARSC